MKRPSTHKYEQKHVVFVHTQEYGLNGISEVRYASSMPHRLPTFTTPEERRAFNETIVKPFYRNEEDYDWTEVASRFVGLETVMHRLREQTLLHMLARYGRGQPILDIGCGSGLHLRHMPAGSVGIDINPRNVARSRAYAPHATVIEGDAEHLPFPDHAFATIVCTEVLEHVVYPELVISEVRRVLKPNGVFLGSVPRASWIWKLRSHLSRTCPADEPFHNEMRRTDIASLLYPFPHVTVTRSFWLLQYFFRASR